MSQPLGMPTHFIYHWSAGSYVQTFNDYHFCITFDGKKAHVVQTLSIETKGAHTLSRNSNAVGVSFMAMSDTNHSVKQDQIEKSAKLVAELCIKYKINPNGEYDAIEYHDNGTILVNTGKTFKAPVIADHCYYANKDNYGPTSKTCYRWDIGDPTGRVKWDGKIINLLPEVKNKILYYYEKLNSKLISEEYASKVF